MKTRTNPTERDFNFDPIRPYFDNEVEEVLRRLGREEPLMKPIKYFFPHWTADVFVEKLRGIHSIAEFQTEVVSCVVRNIIEESTDGMTQTGVDHLKKGKPYLFIANHRDILLDPSFCNIVLFDHGFETAQIGIGNNLLSAPWISDFVRLNKSFVVHRDVSGREMYLVLQRLSFYIRHVIFELRSSVWIAQREGRAKDGNDKTHTALLKMIGLSEHDDLIGYLKSLSIVPVALSYEYDPCDVLKTCELNARAVHGTYKKKPDEDLKSMITGITGYKGRVHLAIGSPLAEELTTFEGIARRNDQIQQIAKLIDNQIYGMYKLWPTNYVAYDLLYGTNRYRENYKHDEKQRFSDYAEKRLEGLPGDPQRIRQIFLSMYANPVKNRESLSNGMREAIERRQENVTDDC